MSQISVKLAVADSGPYCHQAAALTQLVREVKFDRIPIDAIGSAQRNAVDGPFIALVGNEFKIPLLGLSTIVEALNRKFPGRGYLPEEPRARARSRAMAQIIEQRITYYFLAEQAWKHDREAGVATATGARILDLPPPLESIGEHHAQQSTRFLAGDQPSLADCHLAALWWSAQDSKIEATLESQPSLAKWYRQNCTGVPFQR